MSKIQHNSTTSETTQPIVIEPVATQQPEPVAVPANVAEVRLTSAQLKERLDETRTAAERRVLAELGVDDLVKAKELIAKAAPRTDEKWKQLESASAQQATKLAEMESLLAAITNDRATSALSQLSEQAQKAIEEATDDPEERIALVQVFQAAGFSGATAPTSIVAQTVPVVPQIAATTAQPRTAPVDASINLPNRRDEYQRLKQTNPVAAAHYLKAFGRDIFPG